MYVLYYNCHNQQNHVNLIYIFVIRDRDRERVGRGEEGVTRRVILALVDAPYQIISMSVFVFVGKHYLPKRLCVAPGGVHIHWDWSNWLYNPGFDIFRFISLFLFDFDDWSFIFSSWDDDIFLIGVSFFACCWYYSTSYSTWKCLLGSQEYFQ